jgi:restriction system protein
VITIDVKHDGLGKFRRISGPDRHVAEARSDAQMRVWDDQWQKRRRAEGDAGDCLKTLKRMHADEASEDARRDLHAATSILLTAVRARRPVEWMPERRSFGEPAPSPPAAPGFAAEPKRSAFKPETPVTLAVLLHPGVRRRRREGAERTFKQAHDQWSHDVRWKTQEHERATQAYQASLADWDSRRAAFDDVQGRQFEHLRTLRDGYQRREVEAVTDYCNLVLLDLDRPANFPKFWTLALAADTGTLTIDYDLPSLDHMPAVKSVRYSASRDAFDTVVLGERERERLYAEAVFQTCLAAVHVLLAADDVDALRAIVFNGWTNVVDRAKGRPVRACALTVHASKRDFLKIDLAGVDPKACFKALNGSMSSKLAKMAG